MGPLPLCNLSPNHIFPIIGASMSPLFLICFAGLFLLYIILLKFFPSKPTKKYC